MKVLFISPELKYNTDTPPMPLGLMAIGTYLKKLGHEVRIFNRSIHTDSLSELCRDFGPDIVGITIISTRMVEDAIKVSRFFKTEGIPVVWGGIFPSTMPGVILKENYVDFISIGEGEKTWAELLYAIEKGLDLSEIKGQPLKKMEK